MKANAPTRPLLSVSITPKYVGDRERLEQALSVIALLDPILIVAWDAEGRVIVSGMSESQLARVHESLLRLLEVEVAPPKVVYVETIRGSAAAEGKYIRQIGGVGHYAHVKLRLEALERNSGYEFVNEVKDESVPARFVDAVNIGIQNAMASGVLSGHEMVDIRTVLLGGSYHELDSSDLAFRQAGAIAFADAARKADPVLLEPIMSVGVMAPEEYSGIVSSYLKSRRGVVERMLQGRAGSLIIKASVPLAEMLGYEADLDTATRSTATCSMEFARYEQAVPGSGIGDDEAGVPAKSPRNPRGRDGSAAATPERN